MRLTRLLVPVAAAVLAACAGTAPQYYSLHAPGTTAQAQNNRIQADYLISVQPVLIPEEVARPQIVISSGSGAEVVPLNAALWAGPLEAQIRDTLAAALASRLNVVEIGTARAPEGMPVWRIYVDLQRFDSLYGESIRQDAVWRLVPEGMAAGVQKRVCTAQVRLPVGTGMSAMVEGHREALSMLAAAIAQTLPPAGGASPAAKPPANAEGLNFRGCVG